MDINVSCINHRIEKVIVGWWELFKRFKKEAMGERGSAQIVSSKGEESSSLDRRLS